MSDSSCLRNLGFEERVNVLLADQRFAGTDVSELAVAHPIFQNVNLLEELIKGIDHKEKRLIVVDLKVLIDDPFQLKREALDAR